VKFEEYTELGYNYRLSDIQAAVGRAQLRKLPEIVRRRRVLAERYHEMLADIPDLGLPVEAEWARSNWQSYCIMLPPGMDQLTVMQKMLDRDVATRRGVHTSHMEGAYEKEPWGCGSDRSCCGCSPRTCKNLQESENARLNGLLLPMFAELTESDQIQVVKVLKQVLSA